MPEPCPVEGCRTRCRDIESLFGHLYTMHTKPELIKTILLADRDQCSRGEKATDTSLEGYQVCLSCGERTKAVPGRKKCPFCRGLLKPIVVVKR